MPIQFVYTNNDLIGSKIISYATKLEGQDRIEVPSHFSIVVYEWLVIESTLTTGVRFDHITKFKERNRILKVFSPESDAKEYFKRAKEMTYKIYKKRYDFLGAIYLGIFQLLNTHFGIKMPKKNRFDSGKRFFCNELYSFITGEEMSMTHPNDLMIEMDNNENFIEGSLE